MTRSTGHVTIGCRRRGIALIMVMILVAVVSVIGLATVITSSLNATVAHNFADLSRARDLARSGLVHAQYIIERDRTDAVGPAYGPYQVDGTNGSYSISIAWLDEAAKLARISSTGAVGGARRTCSKDVRVSAESYPALVTSLNPIGYWRLGDLTNPATDETGSFSGTYTPGLFLGQLGGIVGDDDTAVEFDGDDDWVETPSINVCGWTSLSITAWIYARPHDERERYIFSWQDDTGFEFGLKDHTKLRVKARLTDGDKEIKKGPVPFGEWVFVAATWQAPNLRLYMNGNEIGSKTDAKGEFKTKSKTLTAIGVKRKDFRKEWKGKLDEIAVFNYGLSAQQIQDLYQAGMGN